jgi:glucose/arabinose dehydrogenase
MRRTAALAVLLVLMLLVLVLAAAPLVFAQAPPWQQGRPDTMMNSPLSPHAQPPAPKPAAEIPVGKIKVPPGFKVELWASGINNARAMTWGDRGTLFVSSRLAGQVYAIVDKGATREVKVIAKGLKLPNGVAFKDGTLYIAEISKISKLEGIEGKLDNPGDLKLVYDILPRDEPHGWKYLSFGPDGKLYFNIGAPCNICMPPETHASIVRMNPDGTGFEYYARGVRNSVGHDFHPVTNELYFTNHGRDWLGEDVPSDTLHHAPRAGLNFGYPHCHQGDIADPEFARGRSCSEFSGPLLKLGPHVASNGIKFYRGSMFPAEYKNRAFIAERGSWNKTEKSGFRVVMVTLQPGQPPKQEVFAEGWAQADSFWGRPVYVQEMKDGSLLVADDYAGAIFRISYSR